MPGSSTEGNVLQQLKKADCLITISTKSDLILRDIDILTELKNLAFAISVNTLDNDFQSDMDNASSITQRITALKELHKQDIFQYVSEKYPQYLSDYKEIYNNKNMEYWKQISTDIDSYCSQKNIVYFSIIFSSFSGYLSAHSSYSIPSFSTILPSSARNSGMSSARIDFPISARISFP